MTTKINLNNIDSSVDLSALSPSSFSKANSAFDAANSAGSYANSSFGVANSGSSYANSAYSKANSAGLYANSAFTTANSAGSYANSAFTSANTVSNTFFTVALSDETTSITTGTAKITFRAPFGMTLYQIPRASLSTASTSGNPAVNIKKNGTTIFSTTLTIDVNEKTSVTAATPAVLSTTTFSDDDEITMDVDTAGTGAKGLKVTLFYRKT